MAQTSTGTAGFQNTVVKLVSRQVIETLRAGLQFLPKGAIVPAEQKPGYNGTFVHVAYPDLNPNTTPLTEGTPPTAKTLGIDKVEFSAAQYGDVVKITDLALMESPHVLSAVAADKVGRQMVETADELARVVWASHATDLYSGGGSSTLAVSGTAYLTASNAMDAVTVLRERNVPTFPNGEFLAITHPRVLRGLAIDTRFVSAAKYGDPTRLFKGSIGGFEGIQFVPTSRSTVNADGGTTPIAIAATVTAATDVFAATAHGLVAGDKVRFRSLASGGVGITIDQVYYVIASGLTANAFKVSTTAGGATIDVTSDGTINSGAWGRVVDVFETYVIGPNSIAFGDIGTLDVHLTPPGGQTDPLHQSMLVGWKAFLGGALVKVAEKTDGTGTNGLGVDRLVTIESASGFGAVGS